MTYPGDSSLSPEVQQRILTTYRQTLQLASQGKSTEALLGCDFLLRLDGQFTPARSLQEMLQAGSPPAVFAELLAAEAPAPVPFTLGALEEGSPDLESELASLLAERRFAELLALAERERAQVAAVPALRRLVEQARARQEAEPYLQAFLDPARQALQAGEIDDFERLIGKARALDESHPALAELEQARGFYTDPTRALGGRRRGISMEDEAGAEEGFGGALALPQVDSSAPTRAAGDGFDLHAPAIGAGEGAGRIAELLREGQAAFERREYQGAIDSWSRIFLIDIDHQEAAQRIEQARQLKAEREREIEEIFHDGVERFDGGELEAAEQAFRRVLELQPSYVLAQEYLEKIGERRMPGAPRPIAAEAPAAASEGGAPPPSARAAAREELSEEILVPPEPGAQRPPRRSAPAYATSARRRAGVSSRFLVIGGAVLVLLATAGWFVMNRWDELFPNAKAVATPAPTVADPIAKARELHEQGRTAVAIAQLRRIPPDDPRSAEAQSLVSQWEAISQEVEKPRLSLAASLSRRESIERAEAALAAGRNVEALSLLDRAGEIAPLAGAEAELAATARERARPFGEQLALFEDGEYEILLNQLWRRREAEKGNADLDRLIVDAYHNLGVLDLQRGDPAAALEKFREARKLDGEDPALARLERFAETYGERGEDLLYRIFVKYLQAR